MTDHTEYQTRADGSIDTAPYMARGREMRSAAFFDILGKVRRVVAGRVRTAGRKRAPVRPVRENTALQPGE